MKVAQTVCWFGGLLLVMLLLPQQVKAQNTADAGKVAHQRPRMLEEPTVSLVKQYNTHPERYRDWVWWKQLEAEISLEGIAHETVTEEQLRNILLFSHVHQDKLDLRSSAKVAYNVYRFHPDESIQLLGLLCVHAIGEQTTMYQVYKNIEYERNSRLKRLALAAVADHYQ